MAQRVIREGEPDDRLGLAFKLVLGRVPNALEKQKLTSALDYYRQHFASNEDAAVKLINQGESKADAAIPKSRTGVLDNHL